MIIDQEYPATHSMSTAWGFSNTPTPKQLSLVAGGAPFQSPSCLLGCHRPTNFCSVSWDKKANSCSFAPGKQPLQTLNYNGLIDALDKVDWKSLPNASQFC